MRSEQNLTHLHQVLKLKNPSRMNRQPVERSSVFSLMLTRQFWAWLGSAVGDEIIFIIMLQSVRRQRK